MKYCHCVLLNVKKEDQRSQTVTSLVTSTFDIFYCNFSCIPTYVFLKYIIFTFPNINFTRLIIFFLIMVLHIKIAKAHEIQ